MSCAVIWEDTQIDLTCCVVPQHVATRDGATAYVRWEKPHVCVHVGRVGQRLAGRGLKSVLVTICVCTACSQSTPI